jgi:hypothetical protein
VSVCGSLVGLVGGAIGLVSSAIRVVRSVLLRVLVIGSLDNLDITAARGEGEAGQERRNYE